MQKQKQSMMQISKKSRKRKTDMIELLSPAGSYEKMIAAIRYGADAVYLAGKLYGMRAAADNFTSEEIHSAVKYAHSKNVRVYITLNTMAHEDEYPGIRSFLEEIKDACVDAFIVADLGVGALVRSVIPNAELHLSTQVSVTSSASANEYFKLGYTRIVLARELTLAQIKEIRKNIPSECELETFIHGSMCIAYSGRCLLSNYFTGRDANRGACAQPCRWNYTGSIREEKRPHNPIYTEENEEGTFMLASKDMCMIEHIPELMGSGINCFKIEGRMKSAYYTSVVTNAYRMAIDSYLKDPENYTLDPALLEELDSVSHREYGTGFFYEKPDWDAKTVTNNGYIREKAYLATATGYDKETGLATFYQINKMIPNTPVQILSPGRVGREFVPEVIYDEGGNEIPSTPHPRMIFKLPVPFEVKEGDILRGS